MNILLTNDDGINAEGINSLFNILSKYYNVTVIAPEREMSACSNAFSIHGGLRLKRIDDKKYTLNGYPADCVCVGVHSDMFVSPDIIVSGINHGPNLGDDQFFSGTVAGARTGYIYGKTGIAISMNNYHKPSEYFDQASEFVRSFIDEIKKEIDDKNYLFSINYPNLSRESIKGVKYTFFGKRKYQDRFLVSKVNENEYLMSLEGTIGGERIDGCDYNELEKGYVSITPLTIDCTDYGYIEKKKRLLMNTGSGDFFKLSN